MSIGTTRSTRQLKIHFATGRSIRVDAAVCSQVCQAGTDIRMLSLLWKFIHSDGGDQASDISGSTAIRSESVLAFSFLLKWVELRNDVEQWVQRDSIVRLSVLCLDEHLSKQLRDLVKYEGGVVVLGQSWCCHGLS